MNTGSLNLYQIYCSGGIKSHRSAQEGVVIESNYEIRSKENFDRLGWEAIEKIIKKREITMIYLTEALK
jgi:hypothetical protein